MARCESPADVRECLAFARGHGLAITPRSGGHSYAGWSTGPGLVIDVTPMASVTFDGAGDRAVIGAGALLIDIYAALAAHRATIPAGSCPTVGIAGLTLGGGVGVIGRAHGLTSDNLLAVEIVTADGQTRTCDGQRHADLFWACRGGGGGNFGVATSFTFRTHPARDVAMFTLRWDWRHAPAVVDAWQRFAPGAPDELFSVCHLSRAGGHQPQVRASGLFLGAESDLERLVDRLVGTSGAEPSDRSVWGSSYRRAMLVQAGCGDRTVSECHLPWQTADGQLAREAYAAKSDFATRPLSGEGIATLLRGVERHGTVPGGGAVLLDAMGGAINRVAPDATAFVHRNALFLAQYIASWDPEAAPESVDRGLSWLGEVHASMRPHVSGQAYLNYTDPDLRGWKKAYYGANYPRLAKVRATYDPDNLFDLPQGI